jgi:hypothetical protein
MVAVQVLARLCEPSSDFDIAEDWYRGTALEDILGLPAERVNDDRVYRTLDRLLPHKVKIEQHLVKRMLQRNSRAAGRYTHGGRGRCAPVEIAARMVSAAGVGRLGRAE